MNMNKISSWIQSLFDDRNFLYGLLATGSISIILALSTIVVKFSMLRHADSLYGIMDPIRVSGREIAYIFLICFVLSFLSYLTPKVSYKFYSYSFALLAFLYFLTLIVQAVLFRITGFGLNREYISNFLENPSEVNKMIAGVVKVHYLIGLGLILLFFLWLGRVPESKLLGLFFHKVRANNTNNISRVMLVCALILVILLEAGAFLPPLESVNPAIKDVPLLELAAGFLAREKENRELLTDIKPEERLDLPLVLEPGESFEPWNVVLIIFESLNWKHCDIYNPGLGATPFLAELAKRGLVIDRMYSVVPHTTKALIPIVAGIYPYLEPEVLEARPGILPERALPHLLKRLGYRTAFFQTANNYESREIVVANLGYDLYKGLYNMPQDGFAYVNFHGREEMMMLNPSLEWIDENRSVPFFITYLTLSSHYEYGYPPNFPVRDYGLGNPELNRYLNAIRYTDEFIKRLFKEFGQRGLIDRTIFVIVGDHGEAFGEHKLKGHNYTLWEEGLRVAGLIYAPGKIKEPGQIDGIRSTLDIVPTIIDMIGLKVKEGEFVGRSLMTKADEQRKLFFSGWSRSRVMALRNGRHKFIYTIWDSMPEVYDNLEDPEDKNNLMQGDGSWMSEARLFKRELDRWGDSIVAQYKQWERAARDKALNRPEDFARKVSAEFNDFLDIYGADFFPEKREPGGGVWIRAGIRVAKKIKRPLRIAVVMKHELGGLSRTAVLPVRPPLYQLASGTYAVADSIIFTPESWPEGRVKLYLGLQDERRMEFISPDNSCPGYDETGLVYIGELTLGRFDNQ